MIHKIGDRFKYDLSAGGYNVWEFIGGSDQYILVESTLRGIVGLKHPLHTNDEAISSSFKYLGNYAKDTNIINLYNILCEK